MKAVMSGAHRWVRCAASPSRESKYPKLPPHETTEEGREAHKAAAECLRNGTGSDNAFVQLYVDSVRAVGSPQIEVEYKVSYLGMEGYIDAWTVIDRCLHIWDLKYGYTLVNVDNNWQLICYAAALLKTLTTKPKTVMLHIVQPRGFHRDGPVRDWWRQVNKFTPYIERLEKCHAATQEKDAIASTGAHCKNCRALAGCYAATKAASVAMDVSELPVFYPTEPDEMERQFELLKKAKDAISLKVDAMDVFITEQIKIGKAPLIEYELRPGRSVTAWRDKTEAVQYCKAFGIDITAEAKPVSIAEAKKRGLSTAMINKLTHKPNGKLKLMRKTDYTELFNKPQGE